MWAVTDRAWFLCYGVPGVRRSKGAVVAFMARNAELRRRHGEQVLLRRGMRAMAPPTAVIFDHVVSYLARVILLLVAFETDRVALGCQQVR
jgi:hypothetical protein